ncbi:MAG: hypothetical protein AAF460_01945 [Pseudomonadota bacterium]
MTPASPATRNTAVHRDIWLLLTFLAVSTSVVLLSVFDPDGQVSRDHANYLRLAQQLLDGRGYRAPIYDATGQAGRADVLFATWPVGYPTAVYLVSKVSGLGVFWASKALNILAIGLSLLALRHRFHDAHHVGFVFLFASVITLASYSSGDLLFSLLFLFFVLTLHDVLAHASTARCLALALLALSLFLLRYVGAVTVGIMGLAALLLLLQASRPRDALRLLTATAGSAAFMVAYLVNNLRETGHITGIERIAAPETHAALAAMFSQAVLVEAVPFALYPSPRNTVLGAVMSLIVVTLLVTVHRRQTAHDRGSTGLVGVLIAAAGVYAGAILALRAISHFDNMGFRFLTPATVLVFTALCVVFRERAADRHRLVVGASLAAVLALSFAWTTPRTVLGQWHTPHYADTVASVRTQFADLPDGSVVAFGPVHMNYLFPRLHNRRPYTVPYAAHKERWADFVDRLALDCSTPFYLNAPAHPLDPARADASVIAWAERAHATPGGMLRITPSGC